MYRREDLRVAWRALWRRGLPGMAALGAAWAAKEFEPEHVPLLPPFLHVEVTNRCNLRCFTCARATVPGRDDLSAAAFDRLLAQVPRAAKLILYGIGEPLLHRDFFSLLATARRRALYTGFFTNLTLLNEHTVARIVSGRPDYVNLSIDGARPEVFERYRTGASFARCLEGARRLAIANRVAGAPIELAVWFDGTADNIDELPGVVELAAELGVPTVMVQDVMDWNLSTVAGALAGTAYHDGNQGRFERALAAARGVARRSGVAVWRFASAGDGRRTCQLPWFYTFITARGLVTPCNWNGYDGRLSFGNIHDEPLASIWNNAGYRGFRRALRGRARPEFCAGCPYYDRRLLRIG